MDKILSFLGRVLFALPFFIFGLNHLISPGESAATLPAVLPLKVVWIILIGVIMIVAALAIIVKKHERLSCLILGLMILVHILTVHFPDLVNPQTKLLSMAGVLKDTGLLGAALFMAGTFKK
jgi:uncharacterized membrane protein